MVNRRPYDAYFPTLSLRNDLITPLCATGTLGRFDVMVNVRGGGTTGQAQVRAHGSWGGTGGGAGASSSLRGPVLDQIRPCPWPDKRALLVLRALQAVRHGVARALQLFDPEWRAPLKAAGLLTRDARVVERKKPGR